MSQLAFVACIRGWQWRRQRQRRQQQCSKRQNKKAKTSLALWFERACPVPTFPPLSLPFHCQILLQQAIAAIGLAWSGQATNVGSRTGVGRGGVALFNSNCNCNSTCYSFLLQMEMETPFQQFSDKWAINFEINAKRTTNRDRESSRGVRRGEAGREIPREHLEYDEKQLWLPNHLIPPPPPALLPQWGNRIVYMLIWQLIYGHHNKSDNNNKNQKKKKQTKKELKETYLNICLYSMYAVYTTYVYLYL